MFPASLNAQPAIVNPSFESDLNGWFLWAGPGSNMDALERMWLVPSGGGPDGQWCMAIKGLGAGGKGAYQHIPTGWTNGAQYRLSVYVKNLVNNNMNYSIGYALGNTGAGGGAGAAYGQVINNPVDWAQATVDFTYSGTDGVTVYLRAANAGSSERAGFEKVELTMLANPATPTPTNTSNPLISPTPTSVLPTPTPTHTPVNGLQIVSVSGHGASVGLYNLHIVNFDLTASYSNPYDPLIVDASFAFTGPSGIQRMIPAYWTGEIPPWRAKIAPLEPGNHNCQIRVRDNQGRFATYNLSFNAVSSSNPGFIHVDDRNPFHLRFSNGTPYYPVGNNVAWAVGDPQMDVYFNKMHENKANWTRVWMSAFDQDIEWWFNTGEPKALGRYSQIVSRRYDTMLNNLQSKGLYVQMCMDTFNGWNSSLFAAWDRNLYNNANGGPCAQPMDLFRLGDARRYYKQRARYIVARWAAHSTILCWELFNEVDAVEGYPWTPESRAIGAAWHADMARHIRSLDPYAHPITTSMASSAHLFSEVWELPEMDMVQLHLYSTGNPRDFADNIVYARRYNKPVIYGECGTDPNNRPGNDSSGGQLHLSIWAGAVQESGCMWWWWDSYIDDHNIYYHYKGLSNFMAGEDWAPHQMKPVQLQRLSNHPGVQVYGSAGDHYGVLWAVSFSGQAINGFSLRLPQIKSDTVTMEIYDSITGAKLSEQVINRTNGNIDITIPPFSFDAAVKIVGDAPVMVPEAATFHTW